MVRKNRFVIIAAMLSLLYSASVAAITYRFKDDTGRVVMSAHVPPHLVKNGYEVLNDKGRVIEVIAPALTPAQIIERDRRLEEERKAAEALAAQKEYDQKILRQYSSPDNAVSMLNRRLEELDALITSRRNSIALAQKTIAENEERAANAERNGRAVPKRVLNAIEKAQRDIVLAEKVIVEKGEARMALIAEFRSIIERLESLTGKQAPEYSGSSEGGSDNIGKR